MLGLRHALTQWVLVAVVSMTAACASDDGDSLTWQCWADTGEGTCDCVGLEPGGHAARSGTDIEDVEDCAGYEICFEYHDGLSQSPSCACGDASFTVDTNDPDISDVASTDNCPAR